MHIDEINKNLRKKLFIYALEEGLIVAFIATIIALIIIWPPENFSLVITFPALIVISTSFYSRFFYIYSIHKKLVKKYRKTYLPLLNEN